MGPRISKPVGQRTGIATNFFNQTNGKFDPMRPNRRIHGAKLVIAKLDRLSATRASCLASKRPASTSSRLAEAKRRGVKLGSYRGADPSNKTHALATKAIQERAAAQAADLASFAAIWSLSEA
jgi:hypothetical protein